MQFYEGTDYYLTKESYIYPPTLRLMELANIKVPVILSKVLLKLNYETVPKGEIPGLNG